MSKRYNWLWWLPRIAQPVFLLVAAALEETHSLLSRFRVHRCGPCQHFQVQEVLFSPCALPLAHVYFLPQLLLLRDRADPTLKKPLYIRAQVEGVIPGGGDYLWCQRQATQSTDIWDSLKVMCSVALHCPHPLTMSKHYSNTGAFPPQSTMEHSTQGTLKKCQSHQVKPYQSTLSRRTRPYYISAEL